MQMTAHGKTGNAYRYKWGWRTVLLLVLGFFSGQIIHAQNLSLSFQDVSLEKIFFEIEKQSRYRFVYTKEEVEAAKPVSIAAKSATLENVLEHCFSGQPLVYSIDEKFVVVKKKENENKKEVEIKGLVLNEKDEPLAGASVIERKTGRGTKTNSEGNFVLKLSTANTVLTISNVGYQSTEVFTAGQGNLQVRLFLSVNSLDETLVIAYGTISKKLNTGSVTKITAEEISKQPVSNPLAALQGRVPGLLVTQTSGIPGSSINIQLRGQNTINPNPGANSGIPPLDNPLFIIDGVPFAAQNSNINLYQSLASPGTNARYNNPYGGISPFNSLNPADIESIEVLRDADATAIYGSRGANGVILITTKKGKAGKTSFRLNISTGISQITRSMRLMNTTEYLAMRREAFKNDGLTPNLTAFDRGYAPDLLFFDQSRNVDWKEYFFGRNASTTDVNGTLSGGSENTQFLINAGYRHDSYVFPGDFGNNRGSLNLNLHNTSPNKKLEMAFSSNLSVIKNNSSRSPSALVAFTLAPNYPELLDANGDLNWNYNGLSLYDNPLAFLKQRYSLRTQSLISNLQLSYRLFPGFTLRSGFGYNTSLNNETSQTPKNSQDPSRTSSSSAGFGTNNYNTWIIEPRMEYKKTFGKHDVQVLVGGTIQANSNTQTTIDGFNYSNDNLLGSISGAATKTVSDGYTEYKYAALFGRITYNWQQRYIVNITARRDGSSRFGPDKQFGNFGSVGVGWVFSDESFLKNSRLLSFGKLRGSYGTTGNDNIGDYQYLSRWAPNLSYSGVTGYLPQNHLNPDFSWAVNRKIEAAVELGFFQNKLLLTGEWFRHRSNNQLITYQLPGQTGFTGVTANFPALIENSGWEFQATSVNLKSKDFSWSSTFNLSKPKNKLVAFPGMDNTPYKTRYVIGQSLNVINAFQYIGLSEATGIYQFRKKDGTATSTPVDGTDYFPAGNLDPKFYGGLGNKLSYRNVEMDFFFQFSKGLGANYLQQVNIVPPGNYGNQPQKILHHWQKPGDASGVQKYTSNNRTATATAATAFRNSNAAYSDASYIRLKTVALSYSLRNSLLNKLRISECVFYLNGQNLLTFTRYKGNDPETRSFFSVPPLKTFVGGIRLTL